MNSVEALSYVLERLSREAGIRPERQNPEALQRKLDAITTLEALRDLIADSYPDTTPTEETTHMTHAWASEWDATGEPTAFEVVEDGPRLPAEETTTS